MPPAAQVCRLCLKCTDGGLMILMDNEDDYAPLEMVTLNGNVELLDRIFKLTSLHLRPPSSTELQFICWDCESELQRFAVFRDKCSVNYSFCSHRSILYHDNKMCCLCLGNIGGEPILLHGMSAGSEKPTNATENPENIALLQQIRCIASIKIGEPSTNDLYVCTDCEFTLEQFAAFRQQCIANGALYRHRVGGTTDGNRIATTAKEPRRAPNQSPAGSDDSETHDELLLYEHVLLEHGKKLDNDYIPALGNDHGITGKDGSGVICIDLDSDYEFSYVSPKERRKSSTAKEKSKPVAWFVCDECGKSFKLRDQLEEHFEIHVKDKPFQCSECGKSFKFQVLLAEHIETHIGVTFQCNDCGASFSSQPDLDSHCKRKYSRTYKHQCHICGRRYMYPSGLLAHSKIHSATYNCDKCDLKYRSAGKLTVHQREMHAVVGSLTEPRAYKKKSIAAKDPPAEGDNVSRRHRCNFCRRIFKLKKNRDKHVNVQHYKHAKVSVEKGKEVDVENCDTVDKPVTHAHLKLVHPFPTKMKVKSNFRRKL